MEITKKIGIGLSIAGFILFAVATVTSSVAATVAGLCCILLAVYIEDGE